MLPYADIQLPIVTAFVPIQASVIVVNDLITAALLAAQFWVVRWTWLLVLACGFLFTGLIAVPYGLVFPEGFAPSGLLGAGKETAAQLSLCTRLTSPAVVIIAILVRGSRETTGTWQRSPGWIIALSTALVTAIVCGLTWAIVANDHILPWIYVNRLHNNLDLLLPIIALTAAAVVLLWVRARSVLDLWLMVMCCSWVFDLSLVVLANSRYTLGWYTGRFFQLQAVFVVLLLFLSETTALYANMARAAIERRGTRNARQIAMDAMAASIGHEIRQPLTAVIVNAEAGICQLKNAEPDLKEVHATLLDIAADGQRIKEIIGGIRTMFEGSTHDRHLLDVNKVVRDALAAVDLELRHQPVIVKTDLDSGPLPVLADNGQLHQVFLNLITNALEAMAPIDRPSVLRITSGIVANSSDIAVTVEDTGVGIADKDRSRIMEPFFSTKVAGTGIGLTICQVILKAHGGSLQVGANEPYGTIFRATLPMSGDE